MLTKLIKLISWGSLAVLSFTPLPHHKEFMILLLIFIILVVLEVADV